MTEHDLTDDALAGSLRVFQRRRGHRYSLDDTLTAWVAARARPETPSVLDLGCGIGSVLLMLAHKLPCARLWGIEAQAESFALLLRNCARNRLGSGSRVCVQLGDLRDPDLLARVREQAPAEGFELVTGTPPYQPPGRGTLSPDPQRAHARAELRGGVEAYLEAAARALSPNGRAVVCADARTPERVERAAAACGLRPLESLVARPAADKPALFAVWTLALAAHAPAVPCARPTPFVARDARGARTPEALALRRFFDLPAPAAEPPSPRRRVRSQRAALG